MNLVKTKKKLLKYIILFFFFSLKSIYANDGAFYMAGNQLIPIFEEDISITKEILTIKNINSNKLQINVYYEFHNPKEEKEILMGFEAGSPEGDVKGSPTEKGLHPYIHGFKVILNNEELKYNVAYIRDSIYAKDGEINSISLEEIRNTEFEPNYISFGYVYHFNAKFKKGKNVIIHTYEYEASESVDLHYEIKYILTAANRWANKQIDDFTLVLDMGNFQEFYIADTFFKSSKEWLIDGLAKIFDESKESSFTRNKESVSKFIMHNGKLIFKKKNFSPKGELYVYSLNYIVGGDFFDPKTHDLPFSISLQNRIACPKSELAVKILTNLPYARRGYVFKDKKLQEYFEKQIWYISNPNYKPDLSRLYPEEKADWKFKNCD